MFVIAALNFKALFHQVTHHLLRQTNWRGTEPASFSGYSWVWPGFLR